MGPCRGRGSLGWVNLEWAPPSPPPAHSFDYTPVVESLTPMWDKDRTLQVMEGLALDKREVLVTSAIDAVPEYRQHSATPSLWPLMAGIAVTAMFVGSIFTPWALVCRAVPIAITLTAWFWPKRPRAATGPLAVHG